ncbi:3,4-dihydroxy 2-butanone 4-phosphate synthase / GTP cyclohydrolase II [Nitratiruptor sp. YY08-26]|uniref:bifunctional 3,4-dihydroxy-2-butanone 4-phosphate synthase/GTP cyclohydrolase II n=1 Tax=unclassified Nitratiruptor TaxID=2624044 RepID=UPI0019153C57|nr:MULTISPECIES: bifunctional 3,4-dihydroxy-2-butanone 4-phosphate synthase/GTP cyclohydrolase II [unclassified Nitratiruptor]BCD62500.1 3,4-dihydroxy 2-butanone 4-phosphate synthase / GTP cyclohydrolase II [Nitratiruptor sp. YY08-13]BCD66436.1 3,4-dihydroxy 2-butanone 4-phosphate synthase / GTP cyclohydrolase II [Nitratiruptor sp. YY08-26]
MPIQRVKEAIEEIKKGNMVVMIDDEDRENEGDLVYAATFSTPEKVNFMASEARGLICVAISDDIAKRLDLTPMVARNDSAHETAFTVSVDAKEATTGISAFERDMTIKLLASPLSTPQDFVRPGHIFPLIAKKGGVLVRTGHTEGSVDLCKLAGLQPAAVICEIMNPDGTMARRDSLEDFARSHNLKIVYISDIVEYRLQNELLIEEIASQELEFFGVKVEKRDFRDHLGNVHTAIIFYSAQGTANVKFHNVMPDRDMLLDQRRYASLINAIEFLKKNSGVLIFLDSQRVSDQTKEFGIGAQILKAIGVHNIRLLTSQKGREFIGLGGFGLDIIEEIEL